MSIVHRQPHHIFPKFRTLHGTVDQALGEPAILGHNWPPLGWSRTSQLTSGQVILKAAVDKVEVVRPRRNQDACMLRQKLRHVLHTYLEPRAVEDAQ